MATGDTTARFGWGAIEDDRADEANLGEVMCGRDIGLFSVMGEKVGQTLSYEYVNRFKQTYDAFKAKLIASGNIGKVGKIDISKSLAFPLASGVAVNATGLKVSSSKLGFIRFGFDLEVINNVSGVPIACNPTVTIGYTTAKNSDTSTSRSYTQTGLLKDMNNKVFVPDYTGFETVSSAIDHNFTFDSLTVTLPDGVSAAGVTIVLHSILVAFKEVA